MLERTHRGVKRMQCEKKMQDSYVSLGKCVFPGPRRAYVHHVLYPVTCIHYHPVFNSHDYPLYMSTQCVYATTVTEARPHTERRCLSYTWRRLGALCVSFI